MQNTKDTIMQEISISLSEEYSLPVGRIYLDLIDYSIVELSKKKQVELNSIWDECFCEFGMDENEELAEIRSNEDGTIVRYASAVADDLSEYLYKLLRA